ncbi:MAG: mechanosensitive ion channel family protein [Rhizobiales bacterium]|nr:mechanosensitive ion channel family protein [Hyphomicrobiales bacterium]
MPAATSPDVKNFLELLAKPDVQKWLTEQGKGPQSAPATTGRPADTGLFTTQIGDIRRHIAAVLEAAPQLPKDLMLAAQLIKVELAGYGPLKVLGLFIAFAGLGLLLHWLYLRATAGLGQRISGIDLGTARGRLRALLARLGWQVGALAAFALGSVGVFLAFEWPPLLKEIVVGYLLVALAIWAAAAILDVLLAPPGKGATDDAARRRAVPIADQAAHFWYWRILLAFAVLVLGWVTVALLELLGIPIMSLLIISYVLGIVLLILALDMVWRAPPSTRPVFGTGFLAPRVRKSLASILLVLMWLSWAADAMHIFWLVAVLVLIPLGSSLTERTVNHLLRPAGDAVSSDAPPSVAAAVIERGIRAGLLVVGILIVARAWDLDLRQLTATESLETRLIRGVFSAAVVILVADFLWHLISTIIDLKIAQAEVAGPGTDEEISRRARLRTLLPIARNILMATIAVVAVLMALAALGVEIGPLIAGAGVLGVAIGFGAQTVVKDVISGMFYLMDDAFRVGEYVQSGSHAGTVESFSIRSVKLRGSRGSLFTVPFGELGSIENQSRDWAVDKFTIGITYDSNIVKAKKLIKQVGIDLKGDPDIGPDIMQPLKMQGVDSFSDNAVKIRLKIMTKPGTQTTVRRAAYFLIKKAFDENGIKFAFPQVRVAGESGLAAAASQTAMEEKPAA